MRLPGGRRCDFGGATSRSSSPQAIVTGTVTRSGSSKTWRRISSFEAAYPGASIQSAIIWRASAGGTFSGRPTTVRSSPSRVASARAAASSSGLVSFARPRRSTVRGPSGFCQSPAGEIRQADAARSAFAISSATQPPSELPATCGRSIPSPPRNSEIARPRAAAVGAAPLGNPGDRPKPGMSSAITSRWRASASICGFQTRRVAPRPWIRTSGSP